jgi:hypothetical protein
MLQQDADKAEMGRVRFRLVNACVVGRIQQVLARTRDRDSQESGRLHGTTMRSATRLRAAARIRGGAGRPWESRCKYCPYPNHDDDECEKPHHLCSVKSPRPGRCIVPRDHEFYALDLPNTCPYKGRTTPRARETARPYPARMTASSSRRMDGGPGEEEVSDSMRNAEYVPADGEDESN